MSVAATLFSHSARIGLSPLSARKMDPADLKALETRADALDVVVSTFARKDGFMVRVHGRTVTSLVARGPLAEIISGALDDWEQSR